MADYYTISEVEAILPKGVKVDDSTADPPSRATVVATIPQITKQIDDAVAEGGGTPPLTGNAAGTAGLRGRREHTYQILVQRGSAIDPKHEPLWLKWHEEFEEYLKVLAGTSEAAAGAPAVAGPPRTNTAVDPWFTRDQTF